MTIDEAIKILKEWSSELELLAKYNDNSLDYQRYNANDLAIKALEQQPCEDCISREAVLEIFEDIHPLDYNANAYMNKIKALPSVTPTYDLEEYSTKLWKLAHERGKAESEDKE